MGEPCPVSPGMEKDSGEVPLATIDVDDIYLSVGERST